MSVQSYFSTVDVSTTGKSDLVPMLVTLNSQRATIQSQLDTLELERLGESNPEAIGLSEEFLQTLRGMLRELTSAISALTTVAAVYDQRASVHTRIQPAIDAL